MTKKDRRPAPATSAVHGGEPRTYSHDALAAPIYQTATYTFADTAELLSFLSGDQDDEERGNAVPVDYPTARLATSHVPVHFFQEPEVGYPADRAAEREQHRDVLEQEVVLLEDPTVRRNVPVPTTMESPYRLRSGTENSDSEASDTAVMASFTKPNRSSDIPEYVSSTPSPGGIVGSRTPTWSTPTDVIAPTRFDGAPRR